MPSAGPSSAPAKVGLDPRGDLALLVLCVIWGSTFFVVKDVLERSSPHAFLAARLGLAAVAVAALAGKRLLHWPSIRIGLALGSLLYASFLFQTVGLKYTTATRSSFITALSVLLVPPVAWLLFRRTAHATTYVGVALATAGIVLLTAPSAEGGIGPNIGDALTMACTVACTFHIVLTERWAREVRITAAAAVQLALAATLSASVAALEGFRLAVDGPTLAAIGYTGLCGSALGLSLQFWGQARTTVVRAAVIFSMEPVFATAFARTFAGEAVGAREVVGGSLVVIAVLVSQIGSAVAARQGGQGA